ncbi:hypothetical protein LTR08_001718 [Meristemomyces frigidus]|nr:hypothetical protein LTR08_001718 [Meristemomyces frigidus]
MPIQRTTCFKMKDEADITGMIEQYKTLEQTARKDGKKYIQEVTSRQTINDPRSQGFNFIASTMFASMDDFKYYDEECAAHGKLKAWAKDKVGGPPLVLYSETQ